MFKSTDGGESWVKTSLTEVYGIEALAIDPSTPTTLYAGAIGLFKSTDGGESWVDTGAPGSVSTLLVDPSTPTTLYAQTYSLMSGVSSGLFKSIDGGANWAEIGDEIGIYGLKIAPTVPTTLYTETLFERQPTVLKSTDGGENWTSMPADILFDTLAVDPSVPTTLYDVRAGTMIVSTDSVGTYPGTVSKSIDSGETWEDQGTIGIDEYPVYNLVIGPSTPTTLYTQLWFDSDHGVFRSSDGGRSWVNVGLPRTIVYTLVIDPSTPNTLYAGTDGGVFVIHLEE